jgi:hypothetical protein
MERRKLIKWKAESRKQTSQNRHHKTKSTEAKTETRKQKSGSGFTFGAVDHSRKDRDQLG